MLDAAQEGFCVSDLVEQRRAKQDCRIPVIRGGFLGAWQDSHDRTGIVGSECACEFGDLRGEVVTHYGAPGPVSGRAGNVPCSLRSATKKRRSPGSPGT